MSTHLARLVAAAICLPSLAAQGTNYDESKVPGYQLPDPLASTDDSKVGGG